MSLRLSYPEGAAAKGQGGDAMAYTNLEAALPFDRLFGLLGDIHSIFLLKYRQQLDN